LAAIFTKHPTVVWEVAYSEPSKKVAEDCGRWIACSLGRVLLAISVDIVMEKGPDGEQVIKKATCELWELVHSEPLSELSPDDVLEELVRSDGLEDHPELILDVPPSKEFMCISTLSSSKEEGLNQPPHYMKYTAGVTKSFQVQFFF
jgi:hypothetical protein